MLPKRFCSAAKLRAPEVSPTGFTGRKSAWARYRLRKQRCY